MDACACKRMAFSLVCGVAMLTVACTAPEHRLIELDAFAAAPGLPVVSCDLQFHGVVDRRSSTRSAGPARHTYEIANLIDHLDEQIGAMLCCGQTGRVLTVDVRHAYAQGKAMRGFYTVVLSAAIGDDSTVLRGRHDVTTWSDSSREFQRGMASASQQALVMLQTWLADSEYCR